MMNIVMDGSSLRRHRPWEGMYGRRKSSRRRRILLSCLFGGGMTSGAHVLSQNDVRPSTLSRSAAAGPPHSSIHHVGESSSPVGLYIHIPYCRRRCRYCDFAIVPIGDAGLEKDDPLASSDAQSDGFQAMDAMYCEALVQELRLIQQTTTSDTIPLQSLYFGGGTPSLAPVKTVQTILEAALTDTSDYGTAPFTLQENAEVTMEMDPGTFTLRQLRTLKSLGINRVSLGVQSFDDTVLESIGRVHRKRDVMESLQMLHEVFGNHVHYSMDLISGLPGVSLGRWVETLEHATTAVPRPSHLSLYDLQVEQGTVFGRWYDDDDSNHVRSGESTRKGIPLPSAEDCAFMYKYASGYLRAKGFEHYEISSYALLEGGHDCSNRRSRHNQIYWNPQGQWFAIGLGSTSLVKGKRFARPRAMKDYIDWVNEQVKAAPHISWLPKKDEVDDRTVSMEFDMLTDVIMTRLRTSEGLDLTWADDHIPGGSNAVLQGASLGMELGLTRKVQCDKSERTYLRLVDPEGFLFSNSIISSIFAELGLVEEDRPS